MTIPQAFHLALQQHRAGRLADAEALYRQILAVQPHHSEALHHLGIVAQQMGRNDLAVEWISRAIALEPNVAAAHSNLGEAYRTTGRLDEAVASFRRALALKPNSPATHYNLANALREKGRFEEAAVSYRLALELKPDYADAHLNLGGLLATQGRFDEAVACYRSALELRPEYPEACNNLGLALAARGETGQAVTAYRRALELDSRDPGTHCNLGNAFWELGRFDEAEAAFRQALDLKPDSAEAHSNLASALRERDRLDEAMDEYRQALALNPDSPKVHFNLAAALKDEGQLDEAIAEYRRALQLDPAYREAHSSLIYALHLHPAADAEAIAKEHRRWDQQFGEPLTRIAKPHANDRNPERRLRIGYVSADFRFHPISFFVAPLLKAHDREQFEIHCYANVQRPDAVTELLRKSADVWRDVRPCSDAQLAECVREDGIDILVDLALHTPNSRLAAFARKPAPVQVSWLGYPASSGISAMDYRFTDGMLEPESAPWSASVETVVRLPETWCCFEAIDEYPEPGALPALRAGRVTFGSLNNFSKVNEGVVGLWVRVLQAVEGSRLLMQCPAGATQTRVRQWFEARGIAGDRLDLVSRTASRTEFLRLFERIGIALDPFPYNGGTTTFEALWMGIPVIALAGSTSVGRVGLSALTNLGLPELVASSEEEYVQIAAGLGGNLSRLAELRVALRARMKASPLTDAPRFARHMEEAYRTMWKQWCAEKSSV